MKRVEQKGFDTKREMEVIDALSEVKQLNKRLGQVNHDELLIKTLARHDEVEKETIVSLNSGQTDDDLKQRYRDLCKYKRLDDDFDGDNFDDLMEIEDPYELLKQQELDLSASDDEEPPPKS